MIDSQGNVELRWPIDIREIAQQHRDLKVVVRNSVGAEEVVPIYREPQPAPALRVADEKSESSPQEAPAPEPPLTMEKIQRPRPTRKRAFSNQQKFRYAVMFAGIREGKEGLLYCRHLNDHGILPPLNWVSDGCPRNYVEAYRSEKWKKRIQDEKHRAHLKLKQLEEHHPGELMELLTVATRPTRPTRP